MTKEQINRAIAESLGWKKPYGMLDGDAMYPPGLPPEANVFGHAIPNYYASLDACADFEKALIETDKRTLYLDWLYATVCEDGTKKWEREWFCAMATAPQRCEAYLRTIGKWVESEIPLRSQPSAPIFPPLS